MPRPLTPGPPRRSDRGQGSTRPLIDKLGVRPGARVAVLGIQDPSFWRQLEARTSHVARNRPRRQEDAIFLGVERPAELSRLPALEKHIKRNGAIWVVMPRGRQDIKDAHAMAAAPAAGLVDVKVVRFSDTHTALKLVIPLARR